MTLLEYVSDSLIKNWFPKKCNDLDWIKSKDGQAWLEIAILDAQIAISAYKEYLDKKYEY